MVTVPLIVNVVVLRLPGKFNIVPEVYVNAPEQVIVYKAKSIVPAVKVNVVQPIAPNIVVVPAPLLTVNAAIVLPLVVKVPVLTMVIDKLVYTAPTVLYRVRSPAIDNAVAGTVNAVLLKLRFLNQLAVVNVCTAVPLPVIDKFGALVTEPPVVPKVNVLVISAAAVNPPVLVLSHVNPVTIAIDKLTTAAVVVVNTILFVPKLIERVFELLESNLPVVNVKVANANVPLVNVVIPVIVKGSPNVVVPDVLIIFRVGNVVLLLLVIVPVP
jgi:hypothetical protein